MCLFVFDNAYLSLYSYFNSGLQAFCFKKNQFYPIPCWDWSDMSRRPVILCNFALFVL